MEIKLSQEYETFIEKESQRLNISKSCLGKIWISQKINELIEQEIRK